MFEWLTRKKVNTHDTQFRLLQSVLTQMGADITKLSTSLTQLVSVQLQRLQLEKQSEMPPNIVQLLIDLLNKTTALITTSASNAAASEAARAAAQKALDDLTAADSAAAALVPAAQAAIDAAHAALPPDEAPPVDVPPVDVPPANPNI